MNNIPAVNNMSEVPPSARTGTTVFDYSSSKIYVYSGAVWLEALIYPALDDPLEEMQDRIKKLKQI